MSRKSLPLKRFRSGWEAGWDFRINLHLKTLFQTNLLGGFAFRTRSYYCVLRVHGFCEHQCTKLALLGLVAAMQLGAADLRIGSWMLISTQSALDPPGSPQQTLDHISTGSSARSKFG